MLNKPRFYGQAHLGHKLVPWFVESFSHPMYQVCGGHNIIIEVWCQVCTL